MGGRAFLLPTVSAQAQLPTASIYRFFFFFSGPHTTGWNSGFQPVGRHPFGFAYQIVCISAVYLRILNSAKL